jgi:autotransporter translocation and assembly factor TamB
MGNTELSVERIAGRIDSGRFTMEGSVGLEDWRPVSGRLALQLQAVPLHWPETADFLVGGDLALTGDAQRALLAGRLELLEGLYYKNFRLNLLSAVTQIKRTAPPANGQARPAWMERIALNVDLTHRHPFAVENNIARLSIAPDFKVGGTLAKPQLTGRAQVTEGEIIYRRKSFTVKRGVVDFINPQKIEPALDISAEARIRQYQVTLAVGGTPDQLAFKLDSDPPLSEADILSLVLIGRTNEEIAGGKGGQSSRQMLAALLSTAWGEDIKERTGVDILELSGGEEEQTTVEPNNPDRLQLTVGKRLSRRLTLKYEIDSTPGENIQRAVSEYQFMQNILAKGFQDSRGRYGGELLFRLEFR